MTSYDDLHTELINAAQAYLDAPQGERKAAYARLQAVQAAYTAWLDAEGRDLAAAQTVERWKDVIETSSVPGVVCPVCGAEHDVTNRLTGDRIWCSCNRWIGVEHRCDGTTRLYLWGDFYFGDGVDAMPRIGGQG